MTLIEEYYGGEFEISDEFEESMLYNEEHDYVWLPVQKDCRPFSTKAWRSTKQYTVGPKGKLTDGIVDFFEALIMLQRMELGDISLLEDGVLVEEVKKCRWRGEGFGSNAPGVLSRSKWVKFPSVSMAETFTAEKYKSYQESSALKEIDSSGDLSKTEKEELRKSRLGQGVFRRRVLSAWDHKCAVKGTSILLVASHIKPWASSNNEERLSAHNGIALSPLYDKAFDSGLISFQDNGYILMSPVKYKELESLGILPSDRLMKPLSDESKKFLSWHRKTFKATLGELS
ncbi:TPA: hypothetical protein I7292_24080 [Vibrio parahaemolyticus]|nr:HNH endonuclease [Vibrio parahaemolyticus]HAS7008638.1 hypothetical protein [Vibrio parahaemolyticus]